MKYHVDVEGTSLEVEVGPEGVSVGGRSIQTDLRQVPSTPVSSLVLDGASHRLLIHREGAGRWSVELHGRVYSVRVLDERQRAIQSLSFGGPQQAGPRPLRAPMPGLVVRVEVEEGEIIEKGRGLVIVEAMKMENELRAEGPARVRRLCVEAGQAVEKDQVLIELEPLEEGEG